MGGKLRFWTAAAIGAVIQYLYDPKAGETRRVLLWEQITDRVLDTTDALSRRANGHRDRRPLLRMAPLQRPSHIL